MAELESRNLVLQWARLPNGRFAIMVAALASPEEAAASLPLHAWTLTAEEEAALKAALSGVLVATNGKLH